jgi:hypothetical protein
MVTELSASRQMAQADAIHLIQTALATAALTLPPAL